MSAGQQVVTVKFALLTLLPSNPVQWSTDTIYAALMTAAVTPLKTDSDPRWGAAGSQNYSTTEVTPGGNYSAGGIALTGTTVTTASNINSLNATSPITWNGDPANPTNARWVAIYSFTDTGKHVIGIGDLGAVVSLLNGLQLKINANLTGTQPMFQLTV
jgi:hypothetical protein